MGFPSKVLRKISDKNPIDLWYFWERLGYHVVPDHFYYPIPNLTELENKDWNRPFSVEGVNMNESGQLSLVREFKKYEDEFKQLGVVGPGNDVDASVYYSMIRELKPETIIEVGAGSSTNVAVKSAEKNGNDSKIIAVEPYPSDYLRSLKQENENLHIRESKAEEIEPDWYVQQLTDGDILFIDSSHVVEVGGDIVHLFLRVLPKLPSGVYIHIHDIHFPYERRESKVMDSHQFWSEGYLLHAFLLFNDEFEVKCAGRYLYENNRGELEEYLPGGEQIASGGASFWIERK